MEQKHTQKNNKSCTLCIFYLEIKLIKIYCDIYSMCLKFLDVWAKTVEMEYFQILLKSYLLDKFYFVSFEWSAFYNDLTQQLSLS